MRLPKAVAVGPMRYAVLSAQSDIDALADQTENLLGHADHRGLRLTITPNIAPDAQASVLLHEVMHGLFYVSGLTGRISDKSEEDIVDTLSPLLLDVLRRNPSLVAYLTESS